MAKFLILSDWMVGELMKGEEHELLKFRWQAKVLEGESKSKSLRLI